MSAATQQSELLATADKYLLKNYRQPPMVLARGRGCEVWDTAGKRYLDMTAGIAVCGLGHSHPTFVARVAEQLQKLVHTSNLFFNEQQMITAQHICERSFADRVYFANSGAEAIEAAMKLARRYQHVIKGAPERTTFVSTINSFHGRTMGAVSITGQAKYREGFGPMIEPVEFIPYGDLIAARRVLVERKACAIIVEPIQAEGGIILAPPGYLAGLRTLCDETGTLLIVDEIQTGMGRTGRWFGHQFDGITPDVMTLAKGLGGGIPIGAIACTEDAAQALTFQAGGAVSHGSTFGGNPLACAAANAVFDILENEGLVERAGQAGDYLGHRLADLAQRHPDKATATRGRGLLRGLVVSTPLAAVVASCRDRGLLLSTAGDSVVRFAPPFIVERAQLDEAVGILSGVLGA